ncbi:glycosyltransferase [Bacteroides bouchesdurhonensis]
MAEEDTLTVYSGINKTEDESVVARYKDITNLRIKYVQVPEFRKLGNVFYIFKMVKDVVKDADFCYLRSGIAASFAAIYCNKLRIPYMAVVNEDIYKNTKNHSKLIVRLSAIPLGLMTKYMVKNANYAIYVTQEYLQQQYPCKGKILGCSDIEFLELNDENLVKRLRKIDAISKLIVLGSVGSVATRVKGQDTVIKALAELKNEGHIGYKYQLVGTGDQNILRNLAKSLNVEDMIEFMGEYSHDNVLRWFEDIDIYLHPSRSEGLPRTIIEAMTKAAPCICSSVGGIPELVSDEFLFSYNGNEVSDVKKLILTMTCNKMEIEAKRNYAKSKNYDPQFLEIRRNAFFEKVLERVKNSKSK